MRKKPPRPVQERNYVGRLIMYVVVQKHTARVNKRNTSHSLLCRFYPWMARSSLTCAMSLPLVPFWTGEHN
jgi:hypothetical protein